MQTILEKIVRLRRTDLEKEKVAEPLETLREKAEASPPPATSLLDALTAEPPHGIHLIAEVKKASPSKGVLTEKFNSLEIAEAYERGGASAISVLTEEKHFQGHNNYLKEISQKVPLPTLRKDFIVDPYQIYQAKLLGAGGYLLIVDCLSAADLASLVRLGKDLGLSALVEVHRKEEVKIALEAGAPLIGINNRNLRTFETDLKVTESLRPMIPGSVPVISESGIYSRDQIRYLMDLSVQGVLVGEGLMRDVGSIETKLKELLSD